MSHIAIRAEGLAKRYELGERASYGTLRDSLARLLRNPFGPRGQQGPEIWALDDVGFEVEAGSCLGIVGRNGSGKSTLLKVLSRITQPTRGEAWVKGRIGSLLEVGTGFHPELTGRENVYFNGSMLGMAREEIHRKFDEIVDFAGVERFIDTPVKRYSSGMYLRLAFSVAAHLETEVLFLDEILSVGDSKFHAKAVRKMGEAAGSGRTVLIVSHNMPTILNFCDRAILLDRGRLVAAGPTRPVVEQYMRMGIEDQGELRFPDPATAPGNEDLRLEYVRITSGSEQEPCSEVAIDQPIHMQMGFSVLRPGNRIYSACVVRDVHGVDVFSTMNHKSVSATPDPWSNAAYPVGRFVSEVTLPANFLNSGRYFFTPILGFNICDTQVMLSDKIGVEVVDTGAMRAEFEGGWAGVIRPRLAWSTRQI